MEIRQVKRFSDNDSYEYDDYEEMFNPVKVDRQARRKRKVRVDPNLAKGGRETAVSTIAETTALETKFETSYQTSRHEAGWLLESLQSFYEQELISDIAAQVKGGKEANVYRCVAHPALGVEWVAAKVYRPRMFRSLSNDKMYRQGREVLKANGRPVKATDTRMMRAMGKKTAFGQQVAHTSWLMYEYTTMEVLYELGASVPKPIASNDNAILMAYVGDEQMAAPPLSQLSLDRDEAILAFREVMRNVELLLANGRIHGDLSAYNILYWNEQPVLIDFPQAVDCDSNPDAFTIFERDVQRVCDYFARQGVPCDAAFITNDLWERYVLDDRTNQLAEASRFGETLV
jgi:RIO kinase 1